MTTINTVTLRVPPKYVKTRGKIKRRIVVRPGYIGEYDLRGWGDFPLYSKLFRCLKPSKKDLRRRTDRQNKKSGGRRRRERKHRCWHGDKKYNFFYKTDGLGG